MTSATKSNGGEEEALIVVSNRLPFVLKRDETTGQWERKFRFVSFLLTCQSENRRLVLLNFESVVFTISVLEDW